MKEPGVKSGKKEQKLFKFKIPVKEKDTSEEASNEVTRSSEAVLNHDKRARSNIINDDDEVEGNFYNLCPSWMGQVFQVTYGLKVYMKHDGFFERGQGTCVNLPLRIMASP